MPIVDEEDPVPVDGLGDDAAQQEADRCTGRGDEAVDADRPRPLPGLREHRHDHPQDHRGGQRAADPLHEPRRHQELLALGQAAEEGGADEDRQPDHEDAPATDQVTEAPGEQKQTAEGDQVGVYDPREARLREPEVALDRRQRHVDDRLVEDDHQHPDAENHQGDPATAVGPLFYAVFGQLGDDRHYNRYHH